jgi:hypothetical protein
LEGWSARAIAGPRGPLPIGVRHELYAHPAAPVVRSLLTFADDPERPLTLETFTNVADPDQATAMRALTTQVDLPILLDDEALAHCLSKRVPIGGAALVDVLNRAEEMLARIAPDNDDFDAAKAAVMVVMHL